jgi:threonine/homoserine/homoserine lactone efflux protein
MALGIVPGPVQVLLISEAGRGGLARGARVLAGALSTFGLLLSGLAAGLSSVSPSDAFLRTVKVAGGLFLLWVAFEALREAGREVGAEGVREARPHPTARGMLAVLLNPGAWIFLATTAAALLGDAAEDGGRLLAFGVAGALLVGVGLVDFGAVLVGTGGRRLGRQARRWAGHVISVVLAGLGVLFLVQGIGG